MKYGYLCLCGALLILSACTQTDDQATRVPAPGTALSPQAIDFSQTYDFGDLLGKSIKFYEAQVSGPKPAWNRVDWRNDCCLNDGSDNGIDLAGGWLDAGDNVKFGFPTAWAGTQLAWSYLEFPDSFASTGNKQAFLNNLRWINDYFIKAHPSDNELWVQVGEGQKDHQFWYPPESSPAERLSFKVDANHPGTDVAAETAASLAAASIVFKDEDPGYSATLLDHAKRLYTFADTYRGRYSDVVPDAATFYNSFSGFQDELVWGALWLYRATGDQAYLTKAENEFPPIANKAGYTMAWDDKAYGSYLLLAQLTGEQVYKDQIENWLDGEMPGSGKTYTPAGLLFGTDFSPIPYAMGVVLGARLYLDIIDESNPKYATYRDFIVKQVDYMLGDNPENISYVVGFGDRYPLRPHHRAATGSTNQDDPNPNAHILEGALVGGPSQDDSFEDRRSFVAQSEPAISYNSALVGVVAAMVADFGGGTGTSQPPEPTQPAEPGATVLETSSPPAVDGVLENLWTGERYPVSNNLLGDASGGDLSGEWTALWDADNLYLAVNVTDDAAQKDSDDPWQDDSVELYLDGDNNKDAVYDANDFQYIFRLDDAAVTEVNKSATSGVEFSFSKVAGGYELEVKLPWSTLQASGTGTGKRLGLDVQVNDDDDSSDRDAKKSWHATSDNAWQNPQAFGTAELAQ